MASPCDSGDNEPVVMIITNQAEAETVGLCVQCFMSWVQSTYLAIFGEPQAAATPAKRGRKAKATEAAPEPPSEPQGPAVDPVTGDDTDEDSAADGSADYASVPRDLMDPEERDLFDAEQAKLDEMRHPAKPVKATAAK